MSIDMLKPNDQKKLKKHIASEQQKASHKREWLCKMPFIGHRFFVTATTGFIFTRTEHLVCYRCGIYNAYEPLSNY